MSKENLTATEFQLSVASAPHVHSGRTLPQVMAIRIIGLLPAVIMAVYNFGVPALRVMALAVCTAVVVEWICLRLTKQEDPRRNLHTIGLGLMFAFLLPAAAPWWLVIIGATITIALGKYVFGGLGNSPLCPPLIAWAILLVSWPLLMSPAAMQLTQDFIDPLARLKYFGVAAAERIPLQDLLFGRQIGGLGATQVLGLILGAVYMLGRVAVSWEIPLGYFVGIVCASLALDTAGPLFHLLAGSTIFGGFFLATEFGGSPTRPVSRVCYGFCAGVLLIIIRVFGIYPDGVPFAILLANLLTPFFELLRPRPFGVRAKQSF